MWMMPWVFPGLLGTMCLVAVFMQWQLPAEELAFVGYMHVFVYPSLLFLGIFGAAIAIEELNRPEKACAWLVRPASILEKYVAIVVLTSLGFFLSATIIYSVFAKMIEGLYWLKFGPDAVYVNPLDIPFNPFDRIIFEFFSVYIVAHAVVLVGGLYFRRIGYLLVVLLIYELINLAIVPGFIDLGIADAHLEFVKGVGRIPLPYWAIVVAICWVVGYHILKRAEA